MGGGGEGGSRLDIKLDGGTKVGLSGKRGFGQIRAFTGGSHLQ